MGGNPFQSKGCKTCRKRRCDGAKPECGHCIKRGVACPGYESRVFLYYGMQPESSKQKMVAKREPPQKEKTGQITLAPLPKTIEDGLMIRMQLSSSFMDSYFPLEEEKRVETIGINVFYYLTSNSLQIPHHSGMLEKAIGAISCMYLGKVNNDPTMVQNSIGLYNQAISGLVAKIQKGCLSDDVFYTVVLFQAYETLHCRRGIITWLEHTRATGVILRQFRHKSAENPLIHMIYNNYQKLAFTHSISTPAIKSEEEYQYLMNLAGPGHIDKLFKLYVGIAKLRKELEDVDTSDHKRCNALNYECNALKEKINEWYITERSNFGGVPCQCDPRKAVFPDLPSTNQLFGPSFEFPSLDIARLYILYWTALVLVEPLIHRARTLIEPDPSIIHSQETPTHHEYLISEYYADQVCRALPFCLQPKMKTWGVHVVIASMAQICKPYIFLRRQSKFDWCLRAYELMVERGMDLALFLKYSAYQQWATMEDADELQALARLSLKDPLSPELTHNGEATEVL